MLVVYWLISIFSICSAWNMKQKLKLNLDVLSSKQQDNLINKHRHEIYEIDKSNPKNELLISYYNFLSNLSEKVIKNIHYNIKHNYGLTKHEVKIIDTQFNTTMLDYEIILNDYFNEMVKNAKYNDSAIFLLDFADLSNFLLQSVIESNIAELKEKFLLANFWYNQPFKYTILRQQMKIVMNILEIEICSNLSICIGNSLYSEYIVECLRHLLNMKDNNLKVFFKAMSDILYDYMHTIKTNDVFRQKMENVAEMDSFYHRNAVDFMDEVLTGQDTDIFQIRYKRLVEVLRELLKIIDDNYELTDENVEKLNDASMQFHKMENDIDSNIKNLLEVLVNNMELNVKIWPLKVQNKLDYLWARVTQLANGI